MAFTRRTQILLDDERHELLRRRSERTGQSIGELIRAAIDSAYAGHGERERLASERRERALADFLDAEPLPVGAWEEVEAELERGYERGIEGRP